MKKQLAEDINNFCAPIRERILDIRSNEDYLAKVAAWEPKKQARALRKRCVKCVRLSDSEDKHIQAYYI